MVNFHGIGANGNVPNIKGTGVNAWENAGVNDINIGIGGTSGAVVGDAFVSSTKTSAGDEIAEGLNPYVTVDVDSAARARAAKIGTSFGNPDEFGDNANLAGLLFMFAK